MKDRISFTLGICLLTLLGTSTLVSAQQSDRPNIVLILADDLGYRYFPFWQRDKHAEYRPARGTGPFIHELPYRRKLRPGASHAADRSG
jgi:hypothetical protein